MAKLNEKQVFPAISIIFLLLMITISLAQFFSDLMTYGWSYPVSTIIFGEETIKTVNIANELVGVFFFVWFLAISIQNYKLVTERHKKLKEEC